MKRETIASILLAALAVFALQGDAFCDMMWIQEDTIEADGTTETIKQSIFLSGQRFAIASGDGLRMVLDMSSETLSTIDMNEGTYYSVSLAEITALRERMSKETDSIIENALKNIPENEREQYRKEIEKKLDEINADSSEQTASPENYVDTGKKKKILGYDTKLFTLDNGDRHEELWCTNGIDTTELELLLRDTKKYKLMKDIGTGFSALKYGFPLQSIISDSSSKVTSRVSEVSFDRIDPGKFAVPAGFRKISE